VETKDLVEEDVLLVLRSLTVMGMDKAELNCVKAYKVGVTLIRIDINLTRPKKEIDHG